MPPVVVVGWVLWSGPAWGSTRVLIEEPHCTTGWSGEPNALVWRPGVGYALASGLRDQVQTFDADCVPVGPAFDTTAFGADDVQGIAWDEAAGRYALVDATDDEVYFVTATGTLVGRCDLAALGATSATGIAYDATAGVYAVTDNVRDRVYLIDDTQLAGGTCAAVGTFQTSAFGSTGPEDITWDPVADQLLIYDMETEQIYFTTTAGVVVDTMPTTATSNGRIGLAMDPVRDRLIIDGDRFQPLDIRGTIEPGCSTSGFTSREPTGLAVNASTGDLAFVAGIQDWIYVMDPDTCAQVTRIATPGVGTATGLAYLEPTNEYVVGDDTDHLYFFDATTGASRGQCTFPFTFEISGLDALPELGLIAVSSRRSDASWFLADRTCRPIHARGAGPYVHGGSIHLEGLAWHRGTGTFVVTELSSDDLLQLSFEGSLLRRFDLASVGVHDARGLVAVPGDAQRWYLVDYALLEVERLDMPAMSETTSWSGRFTSATATLYLWDRGEGRVTGTAFVGSDTYPVFGEIVGATGTLSIGTLTTTGGAVGFPITASLDHTTLIAPPPVGTLTRAW
ncbi:MAG: hypothetical protein H6738_04025 [Alphaproteobacteria bacterium]|nr:hypothetical protein [Alphaproteobacteria bacterium]MCB9695938.1 hypothetical protein [Alphaproteobacteria bacterium]